MNTKQIAEEAAEELAIAIGLDPQGSQTGTAVAIIQAAIEKATEASEKHAAFCTKIANERLEEIARLKSRVADASGGRLWREITAKEFASQQWPEVRIFWKAREAKENIYLVPAPEVRASKSDWVKQLSDAIKAVVQNEINNARRVGGQCYDSRSELITSGVSSRLPRRKEVARSIPNSTDRGLSRLH